MMIFILFHSHISFNPHLIVNFIIIHLSETCLNLFTSAGRSLTKHTHNFDMMKRANDRTSYGIILLYFYLVLFHFNSIVVFKVFLVSRNYYYYYYYRFPICFSVPHKMPDPINRCRNSLLSKREAINVHRVKSRHSASMPKESFSLQIR